jgi:hypothetical protein
LSLWGGKGFRPLLKNASAISLQVKPNKANTNRQDFMKKKNTLGGEEEEEKVGGIHH